MERVVRPLLLAVCAVCAVAIAGCGGGGSDGGARAGDALAYLPADSGFVLVIATDLESDQMRALDRNVVQRFAGGSIETILRDVVADELGLSYDQDVKPLLGNDLVLGRQSDEEAGFVAALDTGDSEKLREVVAKIEGIKAVGEASGARVYQLAGGEHFAVEGDVIVFGEDRAVLERALAQREADDHLSEDQVAEALTELSTDAPVRAFGAAQSVVREPPFERFRGLAWVDALRSYGLTLSVREEELHLEAVANADSDDISEDDLPFATGDDAPEVLDRTREIAGANRDQSQTTVFLLRAVRAGYPDARFVREVEAVERELGIDFEQEILRQFDGPSASAVSPDGRRFAARSTVRDPERLRAVLRRLAPRLPKLVEGLQGLQSEGMALLFLLAPDAPGASRLDGVQVDVPTTPDGLYRISGLTGEGPSQLYFGLVGDVFVVASDEASARAIADEPTVELEGVEGAAVVRADLRALAEELEASVGLPLRGLGTLVGSVEASSDRVRAVLRVELR